MLDCLTAAELQSRWQSVTEDEELAEFVGHPELDAYGEIALTAPPSFVHQRIANDVARQIEASLGGCALVECPVLVDGVLIADVAWLSGERAETMTAPAAVAREIMVEAAAPRNTRKGLQSKGRRFLEHGVLEVVLVELDGTSLPTPAKARPARSG